MKKTMISFFILLGLLSAGAAYGNALASIYNGDQFQMNDVLLVQDADHPNDFYVLPQTFHAKQQSTYDAATDTFDKVVSVNHHIVSSGGHQYSDYAIKVALDEPGELEILRATAKLRRVAGPNARIKGLAPICGIRLAMPGLDTSSEIVDPAKFDPNATFIQYSISSTADGKCDSILTTTEFTLEYRVPIELEPALAKNVTSDVGLILQPIDLILPYKYKDKVSVTVDARSAVQQMKAAADLQGSFEYVTAGVKASMARMVNTLQLSGQLQVDCQNPDKATCDRFVEQAEDILSKTILTYLPMASAGDTNSLIVADKDRSVNASMFKVQLAFDEQSAERIGKFRVDFSNTVYDSVRAQAQIDVSNVPVENLDPIVRKMLLP